MYKCKYDICELNLNYCEYMYFLYSKSMDFVSFIIVTCMSSKSTGDTLSYADG